MALLAGAGPEQAGLLGFAMFALQASIGAVNDLVDIERDRGHKPGKPLPQALIPLWVARLIAAAGLAAGLLVSAAVRPVALVVALIGVAIGYTYDLRLKAGRWSWLPFAAGIALLPVYAWLGATGRTPAVFIVLLPLAILGGAAIALANELADDERDRAVDLRTAVGMLGPVRAWRLAALLEAIVVVVAVGTLLADGAPPVSFGAADGSAALLAVGLGLGRSRLARTRGWAWELQAIGLACLALAWLGGMASRGFVPV